MINWTPTARPTLSTKHTPWFLPDTTCSWRALRPKARFFLWKKKFFLLKKIPKKRRYFLYSTSVTTADRGLTNHLSWKLWLRQPTVMRGWFQRLQNKANLFQLRWHYKTLMYRFKKKLIKLNQENRRRFIKVFFPHLTQNDITQFFLQTKNVPKFMMTELLQHTKIHKQESLNWIVAAHAATTWLKTLQQLNTIYHASTSCTNSIVRAQLPISTQLLQALSHYWNTRHLKALTANNFSRDIYRHRTIKSSYGLWRNPRRSKMDIETLGEASSGAIKQKTLSKYLIRKKRRQRVLKRQYFAKANLHRQIPINRYKQKYPNYFGLKRRRKSKRHFNKWNSKIQAKHQSIETLQVGYMYDYRILHQIELEKKTQYKSVPHKVPDLNLFNFRTFNWQVLT